jgi:Ku protein
MAPARPTWKGSLRLSLIAIPIRVFPATSTASDVSFRQIHRKCHTPIQLKKWCPHCEEEVTNDDIVKGYESSKAISCSWKTKRSPSCALSRRVVDLSQPSTRRIDPIYIERSYYVTPDTKVAGAAFAVIREALEGQAAIGRLALHGRNTWWRSCRASERSLHTLRTAGEVRELSSIPDLNFADAKDEAGRSARATGARQPQDPATSRPSPTTTRTRCAKMIARKSAGAVVTAEARRRRRSSISCRRCPEPRVDWRREERPARADSPAEARVLQHPSTTHRKTRKAG